MRRSSQPAILAIAVVAAIVFVPQARVWHLRAAAHGPEQSGSLPRVVVLATGGTIAGAAATAIARMAGCEERLMTAPSRQPPL
ncbi:MAG TPA: hypothetical protein VD833_19375 [Vicinamibacterales bacterium]|nr:hypothetical protein [Vicinamibacterales bacterium]